MSSKYFPLFTIVFILCALEFLQSGMLAFASAPIRGEIEASPEEYSLVAALYACLAVVVIAKLHWVTERFGWRKQVLGSLALFITGAALCSVSDTLTEFTVGRLVMCLGGASFMTTSRVLINLIPPGPARFTGVKVFATGLAAGTAAAPFVASYAVAHDHWQAIFWILIGLSLVTAALAIFHLPMAPPDKEQLTRSSPWTILILATASFFLLYILQKSYYDFYANAEIMITFALLGIFALYSFFRLEHRKSRPLIKIGRLSSSRYIYGVAMFSFCYIVLGANNYVLPSFLQTGLGFSWETIGHFQAIGLTSTILTWLFMMRLLPKYPSPKKYFLAGFASLAAYGWLLMSVTPNANMWEDILPALALNGVFIMLVLATTAMQTFKDVAHEEELFTHAQQVKNMLGQIAMAAGTSMATLFLQYRSTVHYGNINVNLTPGNPLYESQTATLSSILALDPSIGSPSGAALLLQSQEVGRQATLLAGIDYFWAIILIAAALFCLLAVQKVFR